MAVRLISNFAQIGAKFEKTMPKQVLRACHAVRNEWVQGLTGTRTGRQYRIPGTRKFYTASAPGEAPARRLGDLARTIRVAPRVLPGLVQARVGTDMEHGLYLEYGTENMEPRPSLRPALERARPKIRAIFGEGLF